MAGLSAIGHFFKKLGSGLLKVLGFINHYVSDDMLEQAAKKVVELGENALLNNETRRNQAVAWAMKELHLPESLARWTVETAVIKVKAGDKNLEDAFARWIETHGDDMPPAATQVTDQPPTNPAPAVPGSGAGISGVAIPAGVISGTGTVTPPANTSSTPFVPPVAGKDG